MRLMRGFSLLSFALAAAVVLLSCQKQTTGSAAPARPVTEAAFAFKRVPASRITFLSTQMNPVEEAGKMRNVILKDFPGAVDFRPNDSGFVSDQVNETVRSDPSSSVLVGATHGELVSLYEKGALRPLDPTLAALTGRRFSPALLALCRLDGKDPYYVPWTQATYVMAANRKALRYLPKGATLDALTYDQLEQWAKAIADKTGVKALGFPAGNKGLMHRFFQGYLYPSFTASTLLRFRSADARAMWVYFKDLWRFVAPRSLTYSTMAEPLLTEDVWIAWDHTARLLKAFEEKPDAFVAFPAPVGPAGRGFMAVVAGLAIPSTAANTVDPGMLIDYLTDPVIQARTMRETGFLPVVELGVEVAVPRQFAALKAAVEKQTDSSGAVPTLLPIGLGDRGTDYNNMFMLTFSEIVLEGKDIAGTLDANAAALQAIVNKVNARCWLPDVSDKRPCVLE
jgi:multiple sugar transport system substrate-binding protein